MEKKADVILPANRDIATVLRTARAVLEQSGPALHRLVVVVDLPSEPDATTVICSLTALGSSVEVLCLPPLSGLVGCYNHGIDASQNDVVLLRAGVIVGPGWLRELALVAHSNERTACASPPAEHRLARPAPAQGPLRDWALDQTASLRACAGLPRFTVTPALDASCIYMRRDRIDAVGLLDADFDDLSAAIDDWVIRAQDLGFAVKRANHVCLASAVLPVERSRQSRRERFA